MDTIYKAAAISKKISFEGKVTYLVHDYGNQDDGCGLAKSTSEFVDLHDAVHYIYSLTAERGFHYY